VNAPRLFFVYTYLHLLESQVPDNSYLRDAQSHFGRAKSVDPSNAAAEAFLEKVITSPVGLIDNENSNSPLDKRATEADRRSS